MVYEMLTGQLPFQGRSLRSLINAICSEEPAKPSVLRPEPSPAFDEFVLKALAKEPENRYASADDMLAALASLRRRQTDPRVAAELAALHELMAQPQKGPDVESRLRELARHHPKEPAVLQQLGEFLGRCQRHADAIATFQEALALDPESGLLHWHLALAHQGAGHKAKAADALQKAISLDLDPSLKRHAGMLLKALGARA
jgi:tetratricopeptide (TPR) repeat protein